ncbi:hypothetical protein [Helicobacter sp. 13S00477-4]|uniref:hypothetical protein n=1 Tax=Helicobacter sp. 13S00477-4 TaxID=1905759 RepID=UPI000BA6967C|nr:hypothetical protein [Helicobacter sp. 13S00477-4]PAF52075.1 hypothetical protein BKH44_04160 [Helicobacter sp. 13S00477-4]
MKKVILGSILSFVVSGTNFANALEVTVDPFGYLGVLYNQGIQSSPHSYIGLNARAGANFLLDNNWSLGLGAIGAWSVFSNKQANAPYKSSGDISDAYVKYNTENLKLAFGRYNTDFVEFDWLAGNIQGISVKINDRGMNYWGIYMDSILYNGYQYSGQQGKRIATDLNALAAYNPTAKKSYVGGEVIAGGVDYTYKDFRISPFVLIDTQLPTITKGALVQVGAKAGYATDFSGFHSTTLLRGMFQYGDTDGLAGDDLAGLIWIEEALKHKIFNFGAGFYAVLGADGKGSLWTFSDRSKFYGRGINSPGVPAPYFANSTVTGYLFGGLDTNRVRVDAMVAFGVYQEYSLMADYKIWQHRNMKFNAGGGYVYSYSSKVLNDIGNSSLVFFGKFSY